MAWRARRGDGVTSKAQGRRIEPCRWLRVRVDDVAAVPRADQPERRRPDELQSHGSRERVAVDDVAARAAAPDQRGDGFRVTAGHDRGRRAGPERRRRARREDAEEETTVREAVRLGADDLGRAAPRVAVAEQHDVLQSRRRRRAQHVRHGRRRGRDEDGRARRAQRSGRDAVRRRREAAAPGA